MNDYPYPTPALFFERLLKRADFVAAYHHGRVAVSSCLIMQMRPWTPEEKQCLRPVNTMRANEPWARIGFTASRKVGKAVIRNRARRRLKEAAAKIFPHRALAEHDYVWIARASIRFASWPILLNDAEKALSRLLRLMAKQSVARQPHFQPR